MTGKRKVQFDQLFALLISWQIVAVLIAVYDHFVLNSDYAEVNNELYSFPLHVIFSMAAALMGGIIGGGLMIFWINEKFLIRPYGQSILAVVVLFIVTIIIIVVVLGLIYVPYYTGTSFSEDSFAEAYKHYITMPFHLKNIMVWAGVVGATQFVLQMDRKFGHGVLWKIILGKYHLPREESRIFMFVDLQSSTTIAEELGNEKYHLLLRDFFADVTNAILNNHGSIYQYAGDQVIVSWAIHKNNQSNQCIQCFFDMKKSIEERKEIYMKNFGLVPAFKAGIHVGKVIAGEIGIIKRDITYSGDVLNTTSRIQDKCSELKVEFIASDDLLKQISLQPGVSSQYIGSMKLKGKTHEIGLNAITLDRVA